MQIVGWMFVEGESVNCYSPYPTDLYLTWNFEGNLVELFFLLRKTSYKSFVKWIYIYIHIKALFEWKYKRWLDIDKVLKNRPYLVQQLNG